MGGWWEITQPHVEAAGMEWRGAYPWDWHANVGFSSGYEPQEREKLVDTYMAKFKEVFGRYPASVGSWFIDARTPQYMADRYGIVASCNCRDQVGTDGYTLWGGYWNQGYYPSKLNAYMPAQTRDGQIGVPVFRMLGAIRSTSTTAVWASLRRVSRRSSRSMSRAAAIPGGSTGFSA